MKTIALRAVLLAVGFCAASCASATHCRLGERRVSWATGHETSPEGVDALMVTSTCEPTRLGRLLHGKKRVPRIQAPVGG